MKTNSSQKEQRVCRTALNQFSQKLAITFVLTLLTTRAAAFSLLGPYTDWMHQTNGYRQPDDIGGPVDINEDYRWNVPVLTYGFDQSFLDYFGSNGVAAVENAIQILNELPPASSMVISNYPAQSQRINYQAESENLYDLKSATLALLIEHLGLGQPTRNVFDLRTWIAPALHPHYPSDWPEWAWPDSMITNNFIIERNFDADNLQTSHEVNGTLYTGSVYFLPGVGSTPPINDVVEFPVDPLANADTAIADAFGLWHYGLSVGGYYTGLTRDDLGGLRYLLNTNNVNYENLLAGVRGCGSNSVAWVKGAWRPGMDKISLVPHPFDSMTDIFLATTNQFTDTCITNGVVLNQQVERVVTQPDFLFSAGDTGENPNRLWTPLFERTGTTNWINNAALNGSATNAGPGVIQPQVKITFQKLGAMVQSSDSSPQGSVTYSSWGSFDISTNSPVNHPVNVQGDTNHLTLRFRLTGSNGIRMGNFTWQLPVPIGANVLLQISTNLLDWVSIDAEPNAGAVIEWSHVVSSNPQRFFRVVPQ